MADIYMDVDVALAEVPVNLMPLLDATDFKTIEDAVVFNQAGLALFWNFVTTAGAQTCTAVTPTSGGDYDWTDQGTSGMYAIEIPASGGASINNDTEGFGWFTGMATGVLPWRGPIIGFRAAALNNSLIDAGTTGLLAPTTAARTLDVSAAGNAGIDWANVENPTTSLSLSGTLVTSNMVQIDGQATNGNNATLNLKQLNVVNNAGSAIVATSSGGAGAGIVATGEGNGPGIASIGGGTGNGFSATAGAGSNRSGMSIVGDGIGHGIAATAGATGNGLLFNGGATSGDAVAATAVNGNGLTLTGGTNGHGLRVVGAGTGEGLRAEGGGTGNGAEFTGGAGAIVGNITGNLSGSVGSVVSYGTLVADTAAAVWASGTRTLTSFGTLVADVATAVWGAATRILTAATNITSTGGTTVPQTGDSFARIGANGAGLTALGDARIANLDATVSSRATPAQVNIEVLDVMNTDTITLPGQEAPPLAPTAFQVLGWQHKNLRNRKSQTATEWKLYADDQATVDAKATVSDDTVTAIKQEIVSGP